MTVRKSTIESLLDKASDPVIAAILERKLRLLNGQAREDGHKLGLIAEGGTMRAVVSGGAFIALDFLGLNDTFDTIYGSSAGSINAAYFLSGQIQYGVAVYYQLINNKKFVDKRKLFDLRSSAKIVDMDFLFDEIITKERALDVRRVRESPTEICFTATDADSGKCKVFSSFDPSIDLPTALKAGAAIPVAYNQPVKIGDHSYLDGSASNALPILNAIADGCTSVLVLTTQIRGFRKAVPRSILMRAYERFRLRNTGEQFRETYFDRAAIYNASLDVIDGKVQSGRNVSISVIAPQRTIDSTIVKERALKTVTSLSIANTLGAFGLEDVVIGEILQPIIVSPMAS